MIELPDYINEEWVERNDIWVDAYLDGELIEDCYEANKAEGWVKAAKHNENGQIYIEPGTDEIASETLYGKITFVVKEK